ncbi:MAG TPA: hypothetical protein VD867_05805 [Burkholderiales bacterium]|nr:hypothetical protein [Burkholderiales bacterium]
MGFTYGTVYLKTIIAGERATSSVSEHCCYDVPLFINSRTGVKVDTASKETTTVSLISAEQYRRERGDTNRQAS